MRTTLGFYFVEKSSGDFILWGDPLKNVGFWFGRVGIYEKELRLEGHRRDTIT